MKPILELDELFCGYDGKAVVQGLSLTVNEGDLVCLLGPSGCGKTTALRAIAGFEPVLSGRITLHGELVSSDSVNIVPEKRHLGMVFQDYALFPQMSVADNVAFGLRKKSSAERNNIVNDILSVVGLEGLGHRFPHELSGGQQQRVALARALAPHPAMILMDEPFSNLDVDLRERVSQEVREILKAQGISGVLVTHDQHEAFALGDKIGVMQEGRLLQWDSAYSIYHKPSDRFVADFIGQGVLISAHVIAPSTVETAFGLIQGKESCDCKVGDYVDVLLRPDDVVHDDDSTFKAEVISYAFKGADILYTLETEDGTRLLSLFPSHHNHKTGEKVGIRVNADHLVAFPSKQYAHTR